MLDNRQSILVEFHYENDAHLFHVARDTKLQEMIDVVCGRWRSLIPNMVLMKHVLPSEDKGQAFLLHDMDVCCMFDIHEKYRSNSIRVNVLNRDGEMEIVANERIERRIENACNLPIVESSQSKRKMTELWENEIAEVGQEFTSVKQFREALCNYAIALNFNYKFVKNDKGRVTAQCASNGCGWRIHASKVGLCDTFMIKKFIKEHSCGGGLGTLSHPRASKKWVASVAKKKLAERPLYKPIEMMKDIGIEYGVQVPYYQAWHGKEHAMNEMHGDERNSYDQLRWYCNAVVETNPGSVIEVEVNPDTKRFHRIFVSFHACIVGFVVGCRPLLFLDGTFLKSKYKGILLAATGLNGDNGIFPLSFAIVDQETDENWGWFLSKLRGIVNPNRQITFVSDRAKGLSSSIPRIFPGSHHSYCLRHLIENFKSEVCSRYSISVRTRLVELFKKCAYAYREHEFEGNFLKLSSECEHARDFIERSGKHHWAHAYFQGERYGNLYSNVAESYNKWILEARHLPITQLIDHIRIQMMEMSSRRLIESRKWETVLCPEVEKILADNIKASRGLRCYTSVPLIVFDIQANPSVRVDLDSKTCTCGAWQIFQIPCMHACAAIQYIGRDVYDYCNPYFKSDLYRAAYEKAIYPVPDIDRPPFDPDNVQIRPPITKKRPGRNRKKRIESQHCDTEPFQCGRCKQYGHHNRKTCTAAIED